MWTFISQFSPTRINQALKDGNISDNLNYHVIQFGDKQLKERKKKTHTHTKKNDVRRRRKNLVSLIMFVIKYTRKALGYVLCAYIYIYIYIYIYMVVNYEAGEDIWTAGRPCGHVLRSEEYDHLRQASSIYCCWLEHVHLFL
jgi:hypothetical protein